MQLLVSKATNEAGTKIFSPGDVAVLKNEVRDSDLQQLMLAVIQEPEQEEEIDMKSPDYGDGEG